MKEIKSVKDPLPIDHYMRAVLSKNNLCKSDLARGLNVNPSTITRLFKGEIPITCGMALYFESVSTKKAETWMSIQTKYILHRLRNTQRNELPN